MKNCFSSSPWGFRFWTLEKYCKAMQQLGLRQCCLLTGGFGDFPLAITGGAARAPQWKAVLEQCGVTALEAAMTLDRAKEDLPLIAAVGAHYVRICEVWDKTPEMRVKMGKQLRELGKQAADLGMEVIIENHGGLVETAADCVKFFEAIRQPNVWLNFDAANFLHFAGEDPLEALKTARSIVGFFHLKNVSSAVRGQGDFCRLKAGVIDYQPILTELQKTHYEGCLCLEYEHPEDILQGTTDDLATLKHWLGTTPSK